MSAPFFELFETTGPMPVSRISWGPCHHGRCPRISSPTHLWVR